MAEWLTSLMNSILGGPVTALLTALGLPPADPAHPIPVYFAMEVVVVAIIILVLAIVRRGLSADRPGKLQQLLELVYEGLGSLGEDIIGHGARRFVPLLFTLAVFIFLCNVIGIIPTSASPTGYYVPGTAFPMAGIYVTLGCALVALCYYHYWGIRHHGVLGYLKTFMGPVLAIAFIMIPIELVSHLARGLSLSVRLFANMMAGTQVSHVFFLLVPAVIPALFEALHIAVALLQSFIFVMLTMVYLGGAVSEEH
ncbi:MAG TPA: F0F1 ATP synthase subunit A [Terriglobia bacterium]|nr:F0F1 ATP synthase subunit A [Terriglobia bacterium]